MDEKEPGREGPGLLLATVKDLRERRGNGWLGCHIKEFRSSILQVPIGFRPMVACS